MTRSAGLSKVPRGLKCRVGSESATLAASTGRLFEMFLFSAAVTTLPAPGDFRYIPHRHMRT